MLLPFISPSLFPFFIGIFSFCLCDKREEDLLWFPVSRVSACDCWLCVSGCQARQISSRQGHVVKEAAYHMAVGKYRGGRCWAKILAFKDMSPVTHSSTSPCLPRPLALSPYSIKFLLYDIMLQWIYTALARQVDPHSQTQSGTQVGPESVVARPGATLIHTDIVVLLQGEKCSPRKKMRSGA